jgi:2-oxoglutarate dehydrogenase E1 component
MSDTELFHGPNAAYALELYERYRDDPQSVDPLTRALFDRLPPSNGLAPAAPFTPKTGQPCPEIDVNKVVLAARVARLVREIGHLTAHIDPLGSPPPGDPGLELSTHGLTTDDLATLPASVVGGPLAQGCANALEALGRLRRAYSRSIGYEDDHIQVDEERKWLVESIESYRFFQDFDTEQRRNVLEQLTAVETFERYLQQTYLGQKRFSIEGTDVLVPMLDLIIEESADSGTREVVMGMAHRGRLNVLAHILGKPYEAILSEFEHQKSEENASVAETGTHGYAGDVKYHLGARRTYTDGHRNEVPVTLAPNPSHLEYVNPVVMGRARAAQELRAHVGPPRQDRAASLCILMHGDAAFPGQGVVAESLNLKDLVGYSVGGTIHIIVNNQIGFTTSPGEGRSTLYASDLAKGYEIPIVHVNADDVEACMAAARMAVAYRERFGKDFLIDLVGYRRYGHNEGDEPAFTQPRMYEIIDQHPSVREIWAHELERQGVVTRDEVDAMVNDVRRKLEKARTLHVEPGHSPAQMHGQGMAGRAAPAATAVPAKRLGELNEALLVRPDGFTVNAKLDRNLFKDRREKFTQPGGIQWAHAEALALASVLSDGIPVRMTGQDTERGTFSQRHLVLHDPITGARFIPLQAIPQARAAFAIYNSPLSETAVLGFEYGYSIHAHDALVLWEAQFGDFANSAQVIIDQFLISGNAKWRQTPSLVLLLPHGYEGQGPEHSSARLERWLQLCANDNMRVVYPTSAAQYFHLLRRQAALLEVAPCPLVVMTPKSLLRHPRAASSLIDLAGGAFQPVLDDSSKQEGMERVTRLVLCTGKVYVDLVASKEYQAVSENVAVIRVEELYPFPEKRLEEVIGRYTGAKEVLWVQEEPRNMGAWGFVAPYIRNMVGRGMLRYVGRREAASTAEGSGFRHLVEQTRIVDEAFSGVPEVRPSRVRRSAASHVG